MSRLKTFGACCFALLIAKCAAGGTSAIGPAAQKLAIREEPGRVVLAWSGPVADPMRDDLVAAIARFRADTRRLVIAFNSPGGSVGHGRKVVAAIHDALREHAIDTLVERGAVCASMCVPIYLMGGERLADPGARFMFHEASLSVPADRDISQSDRAVLSHYRKDLETWVTDDLYENDIGTHGVNAKWLAQMRMRISGRDVWLTGQQLVDEDSGIVGPLVRTAAK